MAEGHCGCHTDHSIHKLDQNSTFFANCCMRPILENDIILVRLSGFVGDISRVGSHCVGMGVWGIHCEAGWPDVCSWCVGCSRGAGGLSGVGTARVNTGPASPMGAPSLLPFSPIVPKKNTWCSHPSPSALLCCCHWPPPGVLTLYEWKTGGNIPTKFDSRQGWHSRGSVDVSFYLEIGAFNTSLLCTMKYAVNGL